MAETGVALDVAPWQKQGIFTMAETGATLRGSVSETGDFHTMAETGDFQFPLYMAETGVALGGSHGRNKGC